MVHTASHRAPLQGVRRARLELEGDERRLWPLRYRFKADVYHYYKCFPGKQHAQHSSEFKPLMDMVLAEEAAGRTEVQSLIKAYNFVTYRLYIMEIATDYVDRLEIDRLKGKSCEEFDCDRFVDRCNDTSHGSNTLAVISDYWFGAAE